MKGESFRFWGLVGMIALALSGCATTPPSRPNDACAIFGEKDDWYEATHESAKRWGVPVHVQLAIVYQESAFVDDARPPREWVLGFIPWKRPSTAYGYSQALDSAWDWYISETGNRGADRDDFADAVDFIGWYGNVSYRRLGIAKSDARRQYLAYHEGHEGYRRGTYRKKAWLVKVADKVVAYADRYRRQLASCEKDIKDRGWF